MIILALRTYLKDRTPARLFVDGQPFGWTVEDPGRPVGVKVYADTCIPEMACNVVITYSNKFGRRMPVLHNKPDHSIEYCGVRFTGIRLHGGVDERHTAGCPLVGVSVDQSGKLIGNKAPELTELIDLALIEGKQVIYVTARDVALPVELTP